MRIYFMRHGIATKNGPAMPDIKRPLASEGREKTKKAAYGLKALKVRPKLILTSPLLRAEQTAEIVSLILGVRGGLKACDALRPGGNPENIFVEIKDCGKSEECVLIGHEPDLSSLISRLISGNGSLNIHLKKSGVCCVDVEKITPTPRGTLLWMATPKQLRKIR